MIFQALEETKGNPFIGTPRKLDDYRVKVGCEQQCHNNITEY